VGALGPNHPALAFDVGSGGAAVAAHAAESDHAALGSELLRQVEHHLVDGRAVGLRPAAFGNLHRAVVGKAQLPGDGYYHRLTAAHRIATTRRIDMPPAVTADRLRQRRLETRVDMLG